ncbi:hypothetical protein [Nocardia sp. NPDC052566]|uniref:hypothetical protein n=1 Tax=Nocardia sp. NPDC052566 TaxID=3364330 RepID=UPI0037CA5B3F
MDVDSGLDDRLTEAGRRLAGIASDAEYVDMDHPDWIADVRTVREIYTEVLRSAADHLEAAVGLAVLAGAELRHHMVNKVDEGWWEEGPPVVEMSADDTAGRALAAEVVTAARHVLSVDPTNNLAVFLEGLAHECAGASEMALRAYKSALELDQWDYPALDRTLELDDNYERPESDAEPNPHSRFFWVLRCAERIEHSGDTEQEVWRTSDPAEAREMIESVLSYRILSDPDLVSAWGTDEYRHHQSGDFELVTYAPGQPPRWIDLYDALHRTGDNTLKIDWAAVPLDAPPPALRLPPGQPIRIGGRTHFAVVPDE